ncbi:protein phosphatase 2C domain-containing protein [Microbispora sp. CA-135349]|uniref:protein phosphatase 2C domain-containing protein n=1 Tax=Microbispora sp. CA-135349 TaxID=3239953 RepID=UPI003D8A181B
MTSIQVGDPRVAASPFAIGDPGRAGTELPAGPPGVRVGQSDVEFSAASLPGMVVRAVTMRGLLHRANEQPRQDAFAIARHHPAPDTPARAVAVVCDGVGSLGRSDEAAVLVSRRLAELGASGAAWPDAFPAVNEELRAFAGEPPRGDAREAARLGMATTAVAVAVHRTAEEWIGEVAWVGDSSLWHLGDDGRWTAITGTAEGDDDDFHSTAVRPMPTADGACAFQNFRVPAGALFVMSDGIANPLKWCDDVRATLAHWWERPPDPFTFAAQAAFARKSHVDDRTVVGIWPDEVGAGDPA